LSAVFAALKLNLLKKRNAVTILLYMWNCLQDFYSSFYSLDYSYPNSSN